LSILCGTGADLASNRNEYQEFSWGGGGKEQLAHKAANLTAICELIIFENVSYCDPLTRIALPFSCLYYITTGACGSVDGWGAVLQVGRLWFRIPLRSLDFFSLPNPSGCSMALGFTQPSTEMSTRRYFWR
jgi:hypothetical protein